MAVEVFEDAEPPNRKSFSSGPTTSRIRSFSAGTVRCTCCRRHRRTERSRFTVRAFRFVGVFTRFSSKRSARSTPLMQAKRSMVDVRQRREPEADSCESFIFIGARRRSDLDSHRGNPVVSDARCARPPDRYFRATGCSIDRARIVLWSTATRVDQPCRYPERRQLPGTVCTELHRVGERIFARSYFRRSKRLRVIDYMARRKQR